MWKPWNKTSEPELYLEDVMALWALQDSTNAALAKAEETHHPAWLGEYTRRYQLLTTQLTYCDALALSEASFVAEHGDGS